MKPAALAKILEAFSPRDMMTNLDAVSDMARRIRLKQEVGSEKDELTLCRVMLDLKFMTELVDTLRIDVTNSESQLQSLRSTYERMIEEKKRELETLKDGRNLQPPKAGA
jgi:hypothetical protein